jgi:phage gp16-like protein
MRRPLLIGNKEKALIHVAKAQLGLSEAAYRDVLRSVGVETSKDLTYALFDEVMQRLQACGFRAVERRRPAKRSRFAGGDTRRPLLGKIAAILLDTGLTEAYADGMSRRMFGCDRYEWLTQDQLWRLAAALSIYQKRKREEAEPEAKAEG